SFSTLAILRFAANAYDLSIITHYTLVGAFCLLCGHLWNKNNGAPVLGLVMMLVTDMAINQWVYGGAYGILSDGWWVISACFLLIMYIGKIIPTFKNMMWVVTSSVLASFVFWIISDFQYWYFIGKDVNTQALLPRTFGGFMMALSQGAPFIKNFFMGTLAYSLVFYMVIKWSPVYFGKPQKQTSQSF
nr:hypothetical protein [Saprospiraceae bacterium]